MACALEHLPRSLLVVVAHPDDAEFFAGGWLARVIEAGTEVRLVVLTDGQGGSMESSATREAVGAARRREQQAAATTLGIASVDFIGEEDGRLFDAWHVRVEVARRIRSYRPEVLLTTDPLQFYDSQRVHHPDHRAAGTIALAAAMPVANVRLAAEELAQLEPHTVSGIVLAAPAAPRDYAVLEERHVAAKARSLCAHVSQFSQFDVDTFVWRRAREHAAAARAAHVDAEYAEPYSLIRSAP